MSGLSGSGAATCQSTDKSVCATQALPCGGSGANSEINVAQTLLSVLVRLGTAEKMTRLVGVTALFLLLLLSCHRTNIDRAQWQSMSANDKTLYVRTLLGHEKTKEAKGGNDRVFTRSIDDYVKGIDDAYAHGDTRSVDAIFETMGSPR
ncbi:MAG: hypothetical protein QOI58_3417 [Thermoanaerobaculia bacterium]|nr:hypothetical protein [Thermoanaerobaculia bacterium]